MLAVLLAAGPPALPAEDARLKDWPKGPIRYILTADEEDAFRALSTDAERLAFIERFWARRDPSPRTFENEYRLLFWQRVQEADATFRDSAGPGWKTDRGKIYILHGPPDEIEQDEHSGLPSDTGTSRGVVRWIYVGRPGGRRDLDPVVVVPFVRSASGEFRISYDPRLTSVFLDWNRLRDDSRTPGWTSWLDESALYGSRLGAMLDLGKMQEIPPPEVMLLERVDSYELFHTEPLDVAVDRFEPPGRTDALVLLTYAIPPAGGETEPALVARLRPRGAGGRERVLSEASFRIETTGRGRVAEARVFLEPGTWELLALVVDPDTGTNAAHREVLEIPERGPALRTSDPAVLSRLEPLPYATLATYDSPFVLGGFRARVEPRAEIVRGEPIRILIEAYGGEGPYRATFRLEGREIDGSFVPLGSPSVAEEPLGAFAWSVPTTLSWPTGPYRVRARIEDASGRAVEREIPFTLAER